MKALIVKRPWVDYILDGKKTWEVRGSNTTMRGEIELIQSSSGLVVGKCEIIGCKELSLSDYQNNKDKHCIPYTSTLPYKRTYAWIITKAERYSQPKKYKHPKGAITWVNL